MTEHIIKKLIEKGESIFKGPPEFVNFTGNKDGDKFLNDLKLHPHAFVLACVMDRQMNSERAWSIPYKFAEKIGGFEISTLAGLSLEDIRVHMTKPVPLHRFTEEMSKNFHAAVQLIVQRYAGNAANIWAQNPSSADVVYRFLEFRGVGLKIATMAANILARHFKIPFKDHYSIDISVDVHVKRVFERLGIIEPTDSVEAIIYRARALHPEFPGILDFPACEIGRTWCRPTAPDCVHCYMYSECTFTRKS